MDYDQLEKRIHKFIDAEDIDPQHREDSPPFSLTALAGSKIAPFIDIDYNQNSHIELLDLASLKNESIFDEMSKRLLDEYNSVQEKPELLESDTQMLVESLLLELFQSLCIWQREWFPSQKDNILIQSENRLKSCVFIDVNGNPDIMISTKTSQVTSDRSMSMVLRPKSVTIETRDKKDQFVFGPTGEVKPSSKLDSILNSGKLSEASEIKQTAVYGIIFLMLTFPCLPRQVAVEIFGPQFKIYVPLLSHKQMHILEMDPSFIPRTGQMSCSVSKQFKSIDYVQTLLRWVYWAVKVALGLETYQRYLLNGSRISSWVPLEAFYNAFKELGPSQIFQNLDFSSFEPAPSFYNPMYRNNQYYLRIFESYWTGSYNSQFVGIYRPDSALFKDWHIFAHCLILPRYGQNLQEKSPDTMISLKNVLICLLNILKQIVQAGYIHGDLRLANVCWTKNDNNQTLTSEQNDIITVIDYDFCSRLGGQSKQHNLTAVAAPEKYATAKTDVWSVGIMILKIVMGVNCFSLIRNLKPNLKESEVNVIDLIEDMMISEFREYKMELQLIINKCLQPESLRGSIEEVKQLIESWKVE